MRNRIKKVFIFTSLTTFFCLLLKIQKNFENKEDLNLLDKFSLYLFLIIALTASFSAVYLIFTSKRKT